MSATQTTNLGLNKPDRSDYVSVVNDLNDNMDIIDGAYGNLATGKVPSTRKVNGHALSSDVTVTKGDVGLGNVDNTSDANKPISNAQALVNTNTANQIIDLKSAFSELELKDIEIIDGQQWFHVGVGGAVYRANNTGWKCSRNLLVYDENAKFDSDVAMGGGTQFLYCDADKHYIATVTAYSAIPNTAKYFTFAAANTFTYVRYYRFAPYSTKIDFDETKNGIIRDNRNAVQNVRPEMTTFIDGLKAAVMPVFSDADKGISYSYTSDGVVKTGSGYLYVPIKYLITGKAYTISFNASFAETTITKVYICRKDKTTVLNYTTNSSFSWTFNAQDDTYYLKIGLASVTLTNISIVPYNHTEKYTLGEAIDLRDQSIGIKKFSENVSQFFAELTDSFIGASVNTSKTQGVTASIEDNDISMAQTASTAFLITTKLCEAGKKYVLAYSLEGSGSGLTNYGFQIKLYDNSWKYWGPTVSQAIGAPIEGYALLTPSTGQGGYIAFDLTNRNGQTITGTVYLYDVTDINPDLYGAIDFNSVGSGETLLFASNGGGGSSDSLEGKKVVFYGDSITAQNWYPTAVQQYYGFTMVNAGVGGARISYRGAGVSGNENDMSYDGRINALPTDADIVFVMGGTNDWNKIEIENTLTYSSGFDRLKFKGGLAYIIQHIQMRCSNAKVIICTLIGGGNSTRGSGSPVTQYLPEADQFGQTYLDFRNAEIEVANLLNIPVCDTWSCGINGINGDTMIADNVHPTHAGAQMIADYIIGYMRTLHLE